MKSRILIHTTIAVFALVCGIVVAKLGRSEIPVTERGGEGSHADEVSKGYKGVREGRKSLKQSTKEKKSSVLLEGEKDDEMLVGIRPLRDYCKSPSKYSFSMEVYLYAESRILKLPESERTEKRYLKETNVHNMAELLDVDEQTEQKIYVLLKELVEGLRRIEQSHVLIERKSPSMFIANLEEVNARAKPMIAEARAKVDGLLGERRARIFEGITSWSTLQYGRFLSRRGTPQQISFEIKGTPNPSYVMLAIGVQYAENTVPVKLKGNQPFWKQAPKRWRHILKNNELNLE